MAMRNIGVNPARINLADFHYSTLHGDPMVGRRIVFASFAINSLVLFIRRGGLLPEIQDYPWDMKPSKLNSNKCLLGIMLIALKQRIRLSLTL